MAAWDRARGDVASTAMHRALTPGAAFRFVLVAPAAAAPALDTAHASHAARYAVVVEDGAPDGSEGVVLINAFEVPTAGDERFLAEWGRARDLLARRPGYLGTRLHRSDEPGADLRFVNVARWSSPLAFARATREKAFAPVAAAMPFPSHPALYERVRRAPPE